MDDSAAKPVPLDVQCLGGLSLVAVMGLQGRRDQPPFGRGERHRAGMQLVGLGNTPFADFFRKIRAIQCVARRGEDQRMFHRVDQLANVSGPVVVDQRRHGGI